MLFKTKESGHSFNRFTEHLKTDCQWNTTPSMEHLSRVLYWKVIDSVIWKIMESIKVTSLKLRNNEPIYDKN